VGNVRIVILGKKQDPIFKITRTKRAGGVIEAVVYLSRE
jgi:hypothetical protein